MAGSVIGSVAGAVTSGLFNSKAEKEYRKGAEAATQMIAPTPFQTRSSFFKSLPGGQANFTQFGQNQFNNLSRLSNQAFGRAANFDRGDFAARLLDAANRVNDKREEQAFRGLESRLFNSTGASTGAQRQIADFQSDIEDRRYNRALQAEIAADEFGSRRFGDFQNAFNLMNSFDNKRINLQGTNIANGVNLMPRQFTNQGMMNAAALGAQNTMNFGNGLGGLIGGGMDTLYNQRFGGPAFGSPGGGFTNAGGLGFGGIGSAPPPWLF